ncbi:L-threonylcarbamoyladenylate synthase [Gorillibacterium sp. sgz5001074]|uniref:L-threonylcarbamoyladenylate synthase n=1 Tax=Gorillibacterium sp. sgz5001074 TaxID=3446695 RepID=UPI003F668909
MTKLWWADETGDPGQEAVQEAAGLLRKGELVAFPTETVYGLGADATCTEAVAGIYRAKGRPSDNPLIVHISDLSMLDGLALQVDPVSRRLAEAFWPGPLTLVLPVCPGAVSPLVTAGLDTVAVRMPDHPVALALIAAAGCPVAAPSANRSGRPSPTLAEHVREDLEGRIAGILDGGATGVGLESTVVEAGGSDGRVHVLRPGGVTPAQLAAAAGCAVDVAGEVRGGVDPVAADAAARAAELDFRPRSPGMKYTHYAPKGQLTIVQGRSPEAVAARIVRELEQARAAGERTGVLAPEEHAHYYRGCADEVAVCGTLQDPGSTAQELFAALRRFDEAGTTVMLAEAFPEEGIGLAVMNRLRKAAGHRVLEAE